MKKMLSLIIIMSLVLTVFTSCIGKEVDQTTESSTETSRKEVTVPEYLKEEPEDYEKIYTEKLDKIYGIVIDCLNENYSENDDDEYTGIWEVANIKTNVGSVGYTIKDISGDNIPELIIAINEDIGDEPGTRVLNVYSYDGKNVNCVLNGWARNTWYLLDSGKLVNRGSGGAAYAVLGTYTLEKDGSSTVCEKFYFTEPGANENSVVYYMNTIGEADANAQGTCIVSSDEFESFSDECCKSITSVDIKSIISWGVPEISVEYLDDVKDLPDAVTEYSSGATEYSTKVVFSSEEELKNFKLLSVMVQDIDDFGIVTYSKEEVTSFDSLSNPLVCELTFYGDMPNNGFSVEDRFGNEINYAIGQSGKDGSLYTEIF